MEHIGSASAQDLDDSPVRVSRRPTQQQSTAPFEDLDNMTAEQKSLLQFYKDKVGSLYASQFMHCVHIVEIDCRAR